MLSVLRACKVVARSFFAASPTSDSIPFDQLLPEPSTGVSLPAQAYRTRPRCQQSGSNQARSSRLRHLGPVMKLL